MKKPVQLQIDNKFTDQKILVAVSAGVDSMALLALLHQAKYEVIACYVNHQQRPLENKLEIKCIRNYCQKQAIDFFIQTIDLSTQKKSENKQEFLRNARYNSLVDLAIQLEISVIATAHHLDDQAETMLMRLIKSYDVLSLKGIVAQDYLHPFIQIWRPLLRIKKIQLQKYCVYHGITYCYDSSNDSDNYLRNKIRHQVIPIFTQENNQFSTNFIETMQEVLEPYQEIYDEIKQLVYSRFDTTYIQATLLREQLISYKLYKQKLLLRIILKDVWEVTDRLSDTKILQLIDFILNKERSRLELNRNKYIYYQYHHYYFWNLNNISTHKMVLSTLKIDDNNKKQQWKDWHFLFTDQIIEIEKTWYEKAANWLMIPANLLMQCEIVGAQPEYFLQLKQGTKKLNRLYIDEKVFQNQRYNTPVLKNKYSHEIYYDFLTKKISNTICRQRKQQQDEYCIYIHWQQDNSQPVKLHKT